MKSQGSFFIFLNQIVSWQFSDFLLKTFFFKSFSIFIFYYYYYFKETEVLCFQSCYLFITALRNCFVYLTRNITSTKLIPLACGEKAQLKCRDLVKELTGTEFNNTPLDQYWFGKLFSYPNLKQFVACVLSLSHGQALWKGSSVTKKKEKSVQPSLHLYIIRRRFCKDFILSMG